MDYYVHFIYGIAKFFPKEEIYGVTSQLRRASLSVILNYIEGYSRNKIKVRLNFLETAYGSLKESEYLLNFSFRERFGESEKCMVGSKLANEIGAMLWTEINNIKKTIKQ